MDEIRKTADNSKKHADDFIGNIKHSFSKYQSEGTILRKAFGNFRVFFENNYNKVSEKINSIPTPTALVKPYDDSFSQFTVRNSTLANFSLVHPVLVIGGVSTLFAIPSLYGIEYMLIEL